MGCFSSGGSKQKSVSETKLPEQKEWTKKALELYGPEMGKGTDIYPGERLAGFGSGQEAALSQIGGYLDYFRPGGEMPLFGETGEALGRTLRGEGGAAPITPEATEKYFETSIRKPTTRYFREEALPEIRESYAGPGYWSSARAGAETEATEDLWRHLGETRGQLEWDVADVNRQIEEAKAQRALGAVPLGLEYGGAPTREAGARLAGTAGVFGALAPEQAQRQAEINMGIQQFMEKNRLTDPEDLEIIMALLNIPFSSSFSKGSSWGPGLGYVAASSALKQAGGNLADKYFPA